MVRAIIFDCFGVMYQSPSGDYVSDPSRDKIALGLVRNEELLAYSQELRAKYKIGVLSNCRAGLFEDFFNDIERQQLFDTVVVSSEVGMAKPQPEIFYLVCKRLGIKPNEAILVDDTPMHCEAAASIGMHGLVYQSNQQIKHEIDDITNR